FRGYEGWQVVATSQNDKLVAVILANPVMIKAYLAGVPGNGKSFPNGSKMTKIHWKPTKNQLSVPRTASLLIMTESPTVSGTWTATTNDQSVAIGDRGGAAQQQCTSNMKGAIDDVRIYNRALTEGEVQQLYKAGSCTRKIAVPEANYC